MTFGLQNGAFKERCCRGIILARGDRRDFLCEQRGRRCASKRILGVPTAEIRARFSDLPRDQLPTMGEATIAPILSSLKINTDSQAVPPRPRSLLIEEEATQLANPRWKCQPSPVETGTTARSVALNKRPSRDPTANLTPAALLPGQGNSGGITAVLKRRFRAPSGHSSIERHAPAPGTPPTGSETVSTFALLHWSLLTSIIHLSGLVLPGFLNETCSWLHLWEWGKSQS